MPALLGLAGCGPEAGSPQPFEPRLCDQTGPVQIMAAEPGPSSWTIGEIGDRWVVRRQWTEDNAEEETFHFEAHTVTPCGEDPVPLPEHLWPLTVGVTLMGCDVRDGTIYALDATTGERGEAIAHGLECDPLAATDTLSLFIDRYSDTVVGLDEMGAVTATPIPFAVPEHAEPRAPYLNERWGSAGIFGASTWGGIRVQTQQDEVWILDDEDALWRVATATATATATAHQVKTELDGFVTYRGSDTVIVSHKQTIEPDIHPVSLIDLQTEDELQIGSTRTLILYGRFVELEDGLYDVVERTKHSFPAEVHSVTTVIGDDPLGVSIGPRQASIWDVRSGDVFVVATPGASAPCSLPRIVGDGVAVSLAFEGAPHCANSNLWMYSLDGSEPELIRENHRSLSWWVDSHALLILPHPTPGDLLYEELQTGQSWLLDRGFNGWATWSGPALRSAAVPIDEAPPPYYIGVGERAGLWRTVYPE